MEWTICIDAGHYGKYNQSPAVPAYWESQQMWALQQHLKTALQSYGFRVITTREQQEKDLSLQQRGMKAAGCDLFLSLHSNAAGNTAADHVSVYRLVDDESTDLDERSNAIAQHMAPVIAQTMGVADGCKILTRKSSNDRNGDGQLNDNYYGVLNGCRQAGAPGLLVEHSFHTNPRAASWLLDDENLQKLAQAEAACLAACFGMEQQETVALKLPVLKKGATGSTVKALQQLLYARGYSLGSKNPMDGSFGSKTDAALRLYQTQNDLYSDGIAGKKTWAKLMGTGH